MAKMEVFRVVGMPTYINEALREPGTMVEINTDVNDGGMKPGSTLEKVSGHTTVQSADGETLKVGKGEPHQARR